MVRQHQLQLSLQPATILEYSLPPKPATTACRHSLPRSRRLMRQQHMTTLGLPAASHTLALLANHPQERLVASRARADFNAIRLLFTHEYVLKNDIVEAPADTKPGDLLFQIRYVDMFASLARAAARRGIIILLACHRVKHDAWPGAGLWHDAALGYPIDKVLESWGSMASKLCGEIAQNRDGADGTYVFCSSGHVCAANASDCVQGSTRVM